MTFKTRFAPSPTGPLHLGHAFSALFAFDLAKKNIGEFHLRIDDIDTSRSRTVWEDEIYNDLKWLGITWSVPVVRQSERIDKYKVKLEELLRLGLLYECSCSRKDITDAVSAPQGQVANKGSNRPVYPGTCRHKSKQTLVNPNFSLRLDMERVWDYIKVPYLSFFEAEKILPGTPVQQFITRDIAISSIGDVVLARMDIGTSYHLSVVIDDADTGINNVVRGEDLYEATQLHTILNALFSFPNPTFHHHRLIMDSKGKRLAKRNNSEALSKLRKEGHSSTYLREKFELPLI